ncbi:MAG TPA: DUF72 domain-containing protein [Candidatus Thermoplasmatota archaeon]|nr:DUF72 domain-containing protein [Candidatus Thermoplasmatota archaeon]
MAKAWIGTSGWSYPDWKTDFYEGVPQKRWLGHFATRFPTVEVNAVFYRLPRREWVDRWASAVPANFRFAIKLWRQVTHYQRLQDPERFLDLYVDVMSALPPAKRGPILVQLPPQLDVDERALDHVLGQLRERVRTWPIAVEFRNQTWFTDTAAVRMLEAHDVALCVHDMARGAPVQQPNDASFVYVRRHGPKRRYAGSYTDERVAEDARQVAEWVEGGRDVYVYYNNDRGGNAHRNARSLADALGSLAVKPARARKAAAVVGKPAVATRKAPQEGGMPARPSLSRRAAPAQVPDEDRDQHGWTPGRRT